ncbi:hypothetical protein [Paenibacillus xylanexedens]|uniref:hypothetical protein n=1 Tax=Paenibacillus xylanexedens TaxID=528191 RepID=UPI00119FD7DB|nr:hypothetical protein [Paenibacillus xylanexedens]
MDLWFVVNRRVPNDVRPKDYLYLGTIRCFMFRSMVELQNRKAYNHLMAGISATCCLPVRYRLPDRSKPRKVTHRIRLHQFGVRCPGGCGCLVSDPDSQLISEWPMIDEWKGEL